MRNKKIINLNIILVIFIVFTLSLVNVTKVYAKDDIEIKTKIGFESMFKMGYTVPFNLEITNNLRDIDGEVQIQFLNAEREQKAIAYAKPVSLPLNSTKNIIVNIPLNNNNSTAKIQIVEKGKVVFEKKIFIGTPISPESLLVGIMADNYDSVKYINSVKESNMGKTSNQGIINGKTIELNEKNFPEQVEVLNMFSIIVINDFNTSALNEAQYDALKQWVIGGGRLLIGTGSAYPKTLSVFKDNFVKGNVGKVEAFTSNTLASYGEETREFPMTIDVLDLFIEDGKTVISENNKVLMSTIEKGKGTIGVAAFDFGLNPLSDWPLKEVFARSILEKMLPQNYYVSNAKYQDSWSARRAFQVLPQVPTPKTDYLMILFIVYILLAGPISYIVLKKKDKREYMWVTVPGFAILFSIIIYSMGFGTRIRKPVINVANYIEIDKDGFSSIESYGAVVSPKNGDLKIESEGNIVLKPVLDNGYVSSSVEGDAPVAVKVNLLGDKSSIDYYNSPMFDMKLFSMESENTLNTDIKADLKYEGGKIIGTVTNNSKLDLEDAYIITDALYASLGSIKSGESKNIDQKTSAYSGRTYDFLNIAFSNQYNYNNAVNKDATEARTIKEELQNKDMFQKTFMSNMDTIVGNKIIAFSKSKVNSDLLVNGNKYDEHEKSIIIKAVDLKGVK